MNTINLNATIKTKDHDGYSEDVTWYENGRNRADALIEQMKKVGKLNMDNWTKQ